MKKRAKRSTPATLRARVLADVRGRTSCYEDVREIVVFVVGRDENDAPIIECCAELGQAGGMPETPILLCVADDAARELRRARIEGTIDEKVDVFASAVADKVSGMLGQLLKKR